MAGQPTQRTRIVECPGHYLVYRKNSVLLTAGSVMLKLPPLVVNGPGTDTQLLDADRVPAD